MVNVGPPCSECALQPDSYENVMEAVPPLPVLARKTPLPPVAATSIRNPVNAAPGKAAMMSVGMAVV